MFDFDHESHGWDSEPTREELQYIIKELKAECIKTFRLVPTNAELDLSLPNPWRDCHTTAEKSYNMFYAAARKSLILTVFTAKTLAPEKHFDLFDALLVHWMPEIN